MRSACILVWVCFTCVQFSLAGSVPVGVLSVGLFALTVRLLPISFLIHKATCSLPCFCHPEGEKAVYLEAQRRVMGIMARDGAIGQGQEMWILR